MAPILAFLRNGMYLREFFSTTIGKTGELIAIIAGLADISVIDWLATRCGMLGRLLAHIARWLDDHLVDGARYWVCEVWWLLKRLHARTMQTGQIQRYMFVVLLGTLALCIIVLKPLSAIFGSIIDKLITEGRL